MKELFNFKKNHGVTLLALVLTIIIILILAAVVLYNAFGNTSLLDRASKSKEQHELKTLEEIVKLSYEHDDRGLLNFDKTKTNIENSMSKQRYEYQIVGGDWPIIVYAKASNNKYYKVSAYKDKVLSEITDDMMKTNVIDVRTIWGSNYSSYDSNNTYNSSGYDSDHNTILIVKIRDKVEDYTEEEAVAAVNAFFQAQYDIINLVKYLSDTYDLENEAQVQALEARVGVDLTEDDLKLLGEVLQYSQMLKAFPDYDVEGYEPGDSLQTVNLFSYMETRGLVSNNNSAITVNSVDGFLNFMNTHKNDYFGLARKYYLSMTETGSGSDSGSDSGSYDSSGSYDNSNYSSSSYSSSDSSGSYDYEEVKAILDTIGQTVNDTNIDSVHNFVSSAINFNIGSIFGEDAEEFAEVNNLKNKIVNFIGEERANTMLTISLCYGMDYAKNYAEFLSPLGKIDSTAEAYVNSLQSNTILRDQDQILQDLFTEAESIKEKCIGYNVKVADESMTITSSMLDMEDFDDEIMYYSLISAMGGAVFVNVGPIDIPYDDEYDTQIKIVVDDFSATRSWIDWCLSELRDTGSGSSS